MSLSIIQSGAGLQLMDESGGLTSLTLPTDVTLRTDVPPRWAVYGRNVVLVNTPSQPLIIDATGTVRLLTPKPPRLAPILAGTGSGSLSGAFRAKETFVTLDSQGNIISESDYSPISNQVTIASKFLQASNLDISPDQITLRRLYRTTTNGAVFFQWVDADGNIITSIQDDLSDAGLSILAAPVLGTPPRLTTIAEFRGRLFGSGDKDIDNLRYTEAGIQYAWAIDNLLPIPGKGSDIFGIVGLLPRREALGVGRRNLLVQITGSGAEDVVSGNIDFDVVVLSRELGLESQESMKVYRDVAYFLWKDGVYAWSSEGITCISNGSADGKGNVRSWFVTDSYFNRDKFTMAFAHIDQDRPIYRLFLCSAGSDVIDRWVDYDIDDKTWWGPHKTGLFTPVSAFNRTTATDRNIPVVGSAASVFEEQSTRTDGSGTSATAIEFDAVGKRHAMEVPDAEKYFGEISVFGKTQAAGSLSIVSAVGNLDPTPVSEKNRPPLIKTQYWDMRQNRQRLGRIGNGKHAEIELVNAEVGVDVEVFGYEVDPTNLIGRR